MEEDREMLVLEEEEEEGDVLPPRHSRREAPCDMGLVYLASVVAAMGGLLFGYDVGVISGARRQVAHDMRLDCGQEEAVVGLMPLGALSASLVAGWMLDTAGRKFTMQVTGLMFTLGAVGLAMATNLAHILAGRFVVGFAVSLSAMSECLYISEISGASSRGMLVTLNELGITLGFLLAFVVNYIFVTVNTGWRYMFGFSSIIALLQLVALLFLPKTPHFLILKGREDEAEAVLRKIHRDSCGVKHEVAEIRASCRAEQGASCSQLFSRELNLRKRLFIGLGLVTAQQLTGQPNILYYATDVFQAVGFCGDLLSSLAAVILGLVKVFATILALCLVDRLGRRTLLLTGVSLMLVSLIGLTVFAGHQTNQSGYTQQETCTHNLTSWDHTHSSVFNTTCIQEEENPLPVPLRYLAFVAVVVFVAAYSISFGPITWILLSEIFPMKFKGHAMSLGQAVNWAVNVLVSVTFLDVVRLFTLPAVFSFYLLMTVLSLIFIYKYVPETRNKTLEQISQELGGTEVNEIRLICKVGLEGGQLSPRGTQRSPAGEERSPGGKLGDFFRLYNQEED